MKEMLTLWSISWKHVYSTGTGAIIGTKINQPDALSDFFQCISQLQGSDSVSAIRECQVSEVWLTMAEL